jgi:hypothetical protein
MKRLAALLLAALLVATVPIGVAAGALTLAPSKYLGDGGWGVLSAQSSEPLGDVGLTDGDLVYDTQLDVQILYAGLPTTVPVVVEQFTPGTETVYENVTQPNGTTLLEPTVVPVRLDPSWSNVTISLGAVSNVNQEVPLPAASTEKSLAVTVGSAHWALYHLTPASAFLVGSLNVGQQLLADWWQTILSIVVFGCAFLPARTLARRLGRTPKVPVWWPIAWVVPPVLAYVLDYVPTNQLFGSLSPVVLPFVVTAAAFPYIPRLFSTAEDTLFYSCELRGPNEVAVPEAAFFVNWRVSRPYLAPLTWRAAFWAWAGHALPELPLERIKWKGQELTRAPVSFVAVDECPEFGGKARAGFDRFVFFRTGTRLRPRFPRLTWRHKVTEETTDPEGRTRKVTVTPGGFHVEPSSFEGDLLGNEHRDAAHFVSGLRDRVERASEQERDRLKVYALLGLIWRREREASDVAEETLYRAEHGEERALADEELIAEVLAGHPGRARSMGGEPNVVVEGKRDHRAESR